MYSKMKDNLSFHSLVHRTLLLSVAVDMFFQTVIGCDNCGPSGMSPHHYPVSMIQLLHWKWQEPYIWMFFCFTWYHDTSSQWYIDNLNSLCSWNLNIKSMTSGKCSPWLHLSTRCHQGHWGKRSLPAFLIESCVLSSWMWSKLPETFALLMVFCLVWPVLFSKIAPYPFSTCFFLNCHK